MTVLSPGSNVFPQNILTGLTEASSLIVEFPHIKKKQTFHFSIRVIDNPSVCDLASK
jgi:hypothetical protein